MSRPSVRATIADIARRFRTARLVYGHGTHNADDEAAWLVVHALGIDFDRLAERYDTPMPAAALRRADTLAAQRIAERTPLAYLLNEAWLGALRFYVDERVIVPRSFIAELLRARLRPWVKEAARIRRVLDLCTGGGSLAICAAHAFPDAMIDAVDLSADALAVAERNVREHEFAKRIRLLRSDAFAALAGERYDVILSNPPYVDAPSMRRLPEEYRREPSLALASGRDGLDFTRRILAEAAAHLAPRGLLVVEIGHNRDALERARPDLLFQWAKTSAGDGFVFVLRREDLLGSTAARPSARSR